MEVHKFIENYTTPEIKSDPQNRFMMKGLLMITAGLFITNMALLTIVPPTVNTLRFMAALAEITYRKENNLPFFDNLNSDFIYFGTDQETIR